MKNFGGVIWSVEYNGTLNSKNQVDLAKSILDADSRTLSAIVLGISIIAAAWILGSKLKK